VPSSRVRKQWTGLFSRAGLHVVVDEHGIRRGLGGSLRYRPGVFLYEGDYLMVCQIAVSRVRGGAGGAASAQRQQRSRGRVPDLDVERGGAVLTSALAVAVNVPV